ncbi:hypothetical protein GCM10017771_65350 [Streptomyces capitiformicae]|uniref:Uncharacterized protein n=1 Tax=Streptomyces capitiformicae TaxID=2014920 RepID=A0A919DI74_9ACTN|nr:hypothetical protein GCM10017771_65350 [Streptomyces capitiformicae]
MPCFRLGHTNLTGSQQRVVEAEWPPSQGPFGLPRTSAKGQRAWEEPTARAPSRLGGTGSPSQLPEADART